MKLYRLSALAMAVVSCAYLTIVPSHAQQDEKQSSFNYPVPRNHQQTLDPFLHGEFGMSMNTANSNHAYYLHTRPDDGIDHYSSGTVVDKYRWLEDYDPINPAQDKEVSSDRERNFIGGYLEDDRPLVAESIKSLQTVGQSKSSEVNDWVEAQNDITNNYIHNLPIYQHIRQNANSLKNTEHTFSTVKRKKVGEFRFYRHADGYRRIERIDHDGTRTEIVNERKLSENGKSQMRSMKVSKDGTYVAFFVRQGSADSDPWFIHVVDSKTGELATPIIGRINRTNPAMNWLDDDTLYYTAIELYRAFVFSRDIGKPSFNDRIEVPLDHVDGRSVNSVSFSGEDKRYLIMDAWDIADSVYIKDRKTGDVYRLHNQKFYNKVFKNTVFNNHILAKLVHFDPKTRDVWIMSGENDRRGEIIKTNLDNLKKREVVVPFPEGFDIFNASSGEAYYHKEGDGYFVATYLKDGVSHVLLIDAPTGKVLKDLTPEAGAGSIKELSGNVVDKSKKDKNEDETDSDDFEANENYIKFRFENPTTPATDYKYSIAKDKFLDVRRFDLSPFDEKAYETKLVFYTSKDGTRVPMNISYKKGIKLDGKNPTMLYGYGGYGVIYDQSFGFPASTIWLENGGVWAHAFIRGGGEYGEKWQKDAEHLKRLNAYDDFAAAADYLKEAGYANSSHLGIIGGSNGGLLVGTELVRHPEKYRVAVPQVGVFDQFRHDKAGVTQYWLNEYGSPEEGRKVFDVLKSYSPIHNLKQGTCYPSTLIDTSKRDDRVVPSHSYRFAAALQEVQSCNRPTFLSVDEDAGHSPNTYHERLDREIMTTAFAMHEMGVKSIPVIKNRPTADELKTDKWRAEDAIKEQKRLKQ